LVGYGLTPLEDLVGSGCYSIDLFVGVLPLVLVGSRFGLHYILLLRLFGLVGFIYTFIWLFGDLL